MNIKTLPLFICVVAIFWVSALPARAQSNTVPPNTPTPTVETTKPTNEPAPEVDQKKFNELADEISELNDKLKEARNKKTSLDSQIGYMNNQIQLTALRIKEMAVKIADLTEDISTLSKRIVTLEGSLTSVSKLLIDRIVATYKSSNVSPTTILLSSDGFSEYASKAKYLELVQSHDKRLLFEVQATKNDFEEQKVLLEVKKEELDALNIRLETQKITLDQQKKDKEYLLEITKNDEKKYQQLLQSAQAELEAIQAIVAGKGSETLAGQVNHGDRIATIISGASCNSSGGHVHFMVTENGSVKNPFSYLKSDITHENCSGSSCGSGDGDGFSPSGDWSWPIDPIIRYSQGYGSTWAVAHIPWIPYNFHDGIDINSTGSSEVKAVKSGTLYQGSYTGISGCRLRYVRIDHSDSDIDTLYLHINY
jgi:peptidoglycan hydrolase CwlO-like protein